MKEPGCEGIRELCISYTSAKAQKARCFASEGNRCGRKSGLGVSITFTHKILDSVLHLGMCHVESKLAHPYVQSNKRLAEWSQHLQLTLSAEALFQNWSRDVLYSRAIDGQLGSMGFIFLLGCGLPSLVPQQEVCKKLLKETIAFPEQSASYPLPAIKRILP